MDELEQHETIYTPETREYYLQALTYWLAVLTHGMNSRIAHDQASVLAGYEQDARGIGVSAGELQLLKACARVNLEARNGRR